MKPIKCKCHFCKADIIRRPGPKLHFCNNKCKGEYQRTLKPVTKEWLFDHYINKGMDTTQIAYMVKRDPKSVWNWLKDFDIPTRPRGKGLPSKINASHLPSWEGKKHTEETKKKMSRIAIESGRVPYDPKIGSYMKGRKGKNTPNWKGGITPERQAVYSSGPWVESVKGVWVRDKAICQRCGKNHNETKNRGTFHIHHVVSFEVKELRTSVDNLILLCAKCHRWVHGKKNINNEFIREI
jgi:hypothetical protein